MKKLFLLQIKSNSLNEEGKKALLIAMEFEQEDIENEDKKTIHDAIIRDGIKLYPQYTKIEDEPTFSIRKMTKKEYQEWEKTNILKQKSYSTEVRI